MDANIPSFGIDVITNSIRDLQQEKVTNEHRVSEVRSKRRTLESRHETVLSKFNQLNDIKGKMADTLKVARYKVNQSQTAIECQHGVNQELEERITHIRTTCKEEETRQQEEIELLEGKLASLTELFHSSKDSYLEQSLQEDISVVKKDIQSITSKVKQTDTEAEKLIGLFEAMEIVARKQEQEIESLEIPLPVQHYVMNALEHEKKTDELNLESKKETERQLLSQLEE